MAFEDLFPGCVLVVRDGRVTESYPPKCDCGCGVTGLEWAKHNNKAAWEEQGEPGVADEYEYFEVVRPAAETEPQGTIVLAGYVVTQEIRDKRP